MPLQQLGASDRTGYIPVITLADHPAPWVEELSQWPIALLAEPFDVAELLDHLARVVQLASPNGVWARDSADAG